jgi:hypothetical protein
MSQVFADAIVSLGMKAPLEARAAGFDEVSPLGGSALIFAIVVEEDSMFWKIKRSSCCVVSVCLRCFVSCFKSAQLSHSRFSRVDGISKYVVTS